MQLPKGFEIKGSSPDEFVLKLRKIYGQKLAGRVWNQHLVKKLKSIGFSQCHSDECVFFKGNAVYALYTDDSILAGPDPQELDKNIEEMRAASLDITVEGTLSDFLGVKITKEPDGTYHLTQPHLIDSILKDLRLEGDDTKVKDTPAESSTILESHVNSPDFDNNFNYRSVIGKLNYLEKCTRPDISYALHQCARLMIQPKEDHGKAIKWLGRYLKATATKGLIFDPDKSSFQVYVDADFAGNWDKPTSGELLKEFHQAGHNITSFHPRVHCKVFEDKSGAIEIATVPKMRPRTKHNNIKYHHFRSYVDSGEITIQAIKTDLQPADILTKPINQITLSRHRKTIMGW
jgi:hypothetical protein